MGAHTLRTVERLKRVGDEWIDEATKLYPTGVAAICALVDGEPVGFIATSFTVGVSFRPPMVSFAVQRSSTTWPRLRDVPELGISALAADQRPLVNQLASRSRDRFAGLSLATIGSGAVFLDGSALWLEGRIASVTEAGDHDVVMLEVRNAASGLPRVPLVHHAREFYRLEPIDFEPPTS